jgi:hypothetical protein
LAVAVAAVMGRHGVPGAILALPMLEITKIICHRVQPLAALCHFIER